MASRRRKVVRRVKDVAPDFVELLGEINKNISLIAEWMAEVQHDMRRLRKRDVVTEENAKTVIEDKIMECVDLLAQFPEINIDPRAFDHFRVYDPKAHKYSLRKPPFDWMKDWLDAYDHNNNTELSKEILSWINQQPMGC